MAFLSYHLGCKGTKMAIIMGLLRKKCSTFNAVKSVKIISKSIKNHFSYCFDFE